MRSASASRISPKLCVTQMQSSLSADALANCDTTEAAHSTRSSFQESTSGTSDSLLANGEENLERILQLERELNAARHSIAEKEAKCNRLSELQDHIDSEVQELTEKLFQEAYKMVNEAESRRAKAEKLLAESRLKVDMLSAEVEALKIIVKSPSAQIRVSTPPQKSGLASRFLTPSRKEKNAVSASGRKSASLPAAAREAVSSQCEERRQDTSCEVDPVYHREFTNWRESGAPLEEESPFLSRVMVEEIGPCLNFDNTELAKQVLSAIKMNTLELEPVKEAKPTVRWMPLFQIFRLVHTLSLAPEVRGLICALSNVPRFCPYRLRVSGDTEWCFISMLARNRIASVCDFFTYMRYVNQGIVKSGVHDSYWDVVNLRKNMALAKLGLGFVPKTGGARAENR